MFFILTSVTQESKGIVVDFACLVHFNKCMRREALIATDATNAANSGILKEQQQQERIEAQEKNYVVICSI